MDLPPGGGQVPPAGTPPGGTVTDPPGGGAGAGGAQDDPPKTFDANYVEKLRQEAAQHRIEKQDLKKRLDALEGEKLTAQQKAEKERDEAVARAEKATSQSKAHLLRAEVTVAASKHGLVDPDAAYKLLDHAAVEFDDEGMPKNIDKLIQQLAKDKPYLKGGATPPADSGNTANPPRQGQALTKEDVRKMSREEINARWDEVQKAMSGP